MINKKFSEVQIFAILKESETSALTVLELCYKYQVGQSTYYKWKA